MKKPVNWSAYSISMNRKLLRFFLKELHPRFVDVFSIVVIAAGINVVTGAPSDQHRVRSLLAGIFLTLAGVFATFIRHQHEGLWNRAKRTLDIESEENEEWFANHLDTMDKIDDEPPLHDHDWHLTNAIESHISNRRSAKLLINMLVATLLLATAGGAVAFLPFFETSDKGIESLSIKLDELEAKDAKAFAEINAILNSFTNRTGANMLDQGASISHFPDQKQQ
jgi:hypothetical protein